METGENNVRGNPESRGPTEAIKTKMKTRASDRSENNRINNDQAKSERQRKERKKKKGR